MSSSSHFLHSPSGLPYNLSKSSSLRSMGQQGQPVIIDRALGSKKNGFFIEAGAFNGEYLSNTLYFEVRRNWTGLLVGMEKTKMCLFTLLGKKTFYYNLFTNFVSREIHRLTDCFWRKKSLISRINYICIFVIICIRTELVQK